MISRWLDIGANKSALLIGPRRSGKTTYLKQKYPSLSYVTLDDLDVYDWAMRDPKGFVASLGSVAIIDEIQRIPKLTIAIKYAIDQYNARFYMTGSSTIGLLEAASDSLAGRVHLYHFPTLCWGEGYSEPHSLDTLLSVPQIKQAQRVLDGVMVHGLFPEIMVQTTDTEKKSILKNYRDTYFTRDIMQLSNLENIEGILGVYNHLLRSIGSALDVSNVSRESGLSFPTTKKYLNALSQSELTFKLYGYGYGPAKRYIKACKTYFSDNGILSGFSVALSEGQYVENFVISELEKRRKLGYIQAEALFYYKSAAGREVDVVFEDRGQLVAIEIKATRHPDNRDSRNLVEFARGVDRSCHLILFHLGDAYEVVNGVFFIPIAALYGGQQLTQISRL